MEGFGQEAEGFLSRILSAKDKNTDLFLNFVMKNLAKEVVGGGGGGIDSTSAEAASAAGSSEDSFFFDGCSEDNRQRLINLAEERLSGLSIVLSHRLGSVLKQYLVQQQEKMSSLSFSRISVPRLSSAEMAVHYSHCFRTWVESPHVSYVAGNPDLLGHLSPRDCFVFHLFAFHTCFRSKGDNCYALCVSGVSSIGENIVFGGGGRGSWKF